MFCRERVEDSIRGFARVRPNSRSFLFDMSKAKNRAWLKYSSSGLMRVPLGSVTSPGRVGGFVKMDRQGRDGSFDWRMGVLPAPENDLGLFPTQTAKFKVYRLWSARKLTVIGRKRRIIDHSSARRYRFFHWKGGGVGY